MEFKASRLLSTAPLLLSLELGVFGFLPSVKANPILAASFIGTAVALACWWVVLIVKMATEGRAPKFAVAILKQHYVQACAHTSILLYWGWYFREVYSHGYQIVAQLIFAYAFDMLLQLSRKGTYTLGFGPFPVILSTNLFLWFKDDWFYWQFVLIAVGFSVKELIHWTRNGKSVHIFNPSSFPLAVGCWILLFAHHFDITWGEAIAGTQFRPPNIFPFIFLVSLPGQFFFGVTTMTISAVATMYAWGVAYFALTGMPFHYQSYIPIAVFLAMHLLFTDPSTSPRGELPRVLYGVAYAVTVIVLETLVKPQFPSKLLLVPVLNLCVPLFERVGKAAALRPFDPARIAPGIVGWRRNVGYMTVWASVFVVLLSLRGIGDNFPGQELPLWREACQRQGGKACTRLSYVESLACHHNSGWGCNELGIVAHSKGQDEDAQQVFKAACQLGAWSGCENVARLQASQPLERVAPATVDYPALLSVFKWERFPRLEKMPEKELLSVACGKGWTEACERVAGHASGVTRL